MLEGEEEAPILEGSVPNRMDQPSRKRPRTEDEDAHALPLENRATMQCGEAKPLNYESIATAEGKAAEAQDEIFPAALCAGPKQPKPRPASGFYGVSANKNRWAAKIHYDCKLHHIGSFNTKQGAALAYDRKARQCGEDKVLNYESIKAAEEAAAEAQAEHSLLHPQQPKSRPASGFYGVPRPASKKTKQETEDEKAKKETEDEKAKNDRQYKVMGAAEEAEV